MFGIKKGFWGRIWKFVKKWAPKIIGIAIEEKAKGKKESGPKCVIRGAGGDQETKE